MIDKAILAKVLSKKTGTEKLEDADLSQMLQLRLSD